MTTRRAPRVAPLTAQEAAAAAPDVAESISRVAPLGNPVVGVLLRHPELSSLYLPFSDYLKNQGLLEQADRRLAILRTAWNCGADHQWVAHARYARADGVPQEALERIATGPAALGWTRREAAILRAADELHADRDISDECWAALAEHLDAARLVELVMLVGNYEMVAMLMNACDIPPAEPAPDLPGNRFRTSRSATV